MGTDNGAAPGPPANYHQVTTCVNCGHRRETGDVDIERMGYLAEELTAWARAAEAGTTGVR